MEKEFVPYELAFKLKELGFDEPCFKMSEHRKACEEQLKPEGCQLHNLHCGYPDCTIDKSITSIPLPTLSQAFRWFREKYEIYYIIEGSKKFGFQHFIYDDKGSYEIKSEETFKNYEEAELACLTKLIEICSVE